MKNTTIVFYLLQSYEGVVPNCGTDSNFFAFFLKKHLSRADQHVQVMCKVMKNEIVHLL